MDIRQITVGPENPVRILPPGLLSRSLSAFEAFQKRSPYGPFSSLNLLELLAIVFDLCRDEFGKKRTGKIEVFENSRNEALLLLYENLALSPEIDNGIVKRITLRQASLIDESFNVSLGWKSLMQDTTVRIRGRSALEVHSDQSISAAAATVIKHCPYYPPSTAGFLNKWRNRLLKLVCTPETSETIADLALEIENRPRLLKLTGWCGGTVLHPCCRLGNLGQLQLLLRTIQEREVQRRIGLTRTELLNWRNVDGCTPFFIAKLYGQRSAACMMLEAGADSTIPDRFVHDLN
jgi:hypothetical protein